MTCQSCRSNAMRIRRSKGDLYAAARKAHGGPPSATPRAVEKAKAELADNRAISDQHDALCEELITTA